MGPRPLAAGASLWFGSRMRRVLLAVLGVLIVGVSSGCASSADEDAAGGSGVMVDEGSWYSREAWPHDGNPIESTNFIVYSDSASVEARHEVASVAEDVWAELLDELSIEPVMLTYPEGRDRIDIYAYRDHNSQNWGGKAYYGGLLVWSPDHDQRQTGINRLSPVLKHELVHVIQYLISGRDSTPFDVWFIEGLPLALAGDTTAIRGLDQLDRLTAKYGTISPISVKSYFQITGPGAGEHFYYPMFQLAVEYLMDDDGHGGSPVDMRDVMIDVAEGASFEAAFEDRMGLRVDDFEDEFFGLMSAYLPQYGNPLFSPVGFTFVSALVIVFVIGALAVGHRRWRLAAASGNIDEAGPGRAARIGFYSEITIASAVVIVFFLGVLFAVGTEDAFYNPAYASVRLVAFAILASYLFGSIVLLLWAVHQWTRHSRSAFLVAPLIIVATGATIFVFIIVSAII
jgi:hypothetical protein